ncbi:hypothetical protein DES49_1589 [Halospina denitrificans]|uniref:DUF6160 domain-containing protein n=1 Tax=Halospina denitrificans TaxID=332522 RepID=A0A4R7JUA5_9GAMM|nr:DUF6160 family protein [Halospina denitrificans]TDT41494.1 hypothetical protein DES49_1589 [Halospina denitrificans]
MYTMKKSLIAVSIAAMPLAGVAELQPMNDTQMSGVTGQAGVTIELSTEATIDSVEYSQGSDTGSMLMNNVRIGGHDPGETLDVDINVDLVDSSGSISNPQGAMPTDLEDGDAFINVRPQGTGNGGGTLGTVEQGLDIGSPDATDGGALELQSSDGSNSATLISNISADFWFSQLDLTARVNNQIAGGNPDSGSIRLRTIFSGELDADFDVAAVSLPGVRISGEDRLASLQDPTTDMSSEAISGVTIRAEIGAGPAISGNAEPSETLRVDLTDFTASIWMPEVNVGSGVDSVASIGSVGIENLRINDTQMSIYGRE